MFGISLPASLVFHLLSSTGMHPSKPLPYIKCIDKCTYTYTFSDKWDPAIYILFNNMLFSLNMSWRSFHVSIYKLISFFLMVV